MRCSFLVLCLTLTVSSPLQADTVAERVQAASVTVVTPAGSVGTGLVVQRMIGEERVAFVWTAAHVIESSRGEDGLVEGVRVIHDVYTNGRRTGRHELSVRVVALSDHRNGHDLALMEIEHRNILPSHVTAHFYLDPTVPPTGTPLYHVGSLQGLDGAQSLTEGVMARSGREVDGTFFDQVTRRHSTPIRFSSARHSMGVIVSPLGCAGYRPASAWSDSRVQSTPS